MHFNMYNSSNIKNLKGTRIFHCLIFKLFFPNLFFFYHRQETTISGIVPILNNNFRSLFSEVKIQVVNIFPDLLLQNLSLFIKNKNNGEITKFVKKCELSTIGTRQVIKDR